MKKTPLFSYFLAGKDTPVDMASSFWNSRLPANRQGGQAGTDGLTYGEYFIAVSDMLVREGSRLVQIARGRYPEASDDATVIVTADIFLEKHGAFYHPSRVVIFTRKDMLQLVVNAAVSTAGKVVLKKEFAHMRSLYEVTSEPRLPKTFWLGRGYFPPKGDLDMFVGEWLEGYHEFHWTRDSPDNLQKLVVWDHGTTPCLLSEAQTREVFRQASRILTELYNPITFQQVYPWHHASGDFVIHLDKERVHVKLVTVRQYESMIEPEDAPDIEMILHAMLLFLFNLTIRMRIDRLDGVGETVWSHDIAIKGTLEGFWDGMKAMEKRYPQTGVTGDLFIDFLQSWTVSELRDLVEPLAVLYALGEAEVGLINAHLAEHVRFISTEIRRLPAQVSKE